MKTIKFTLLVVISLTTCFILNACGNGNKQESATNSSSKVTQTTKSSEKSETSSTMEKATANSSSQDSKANQIDTGNSSKQDANTNQKEATTTQMATANMDIQAIAGGDFSSIAGTWQDDLGNQLVFDANGLLSHTYSGNESSDYVLTNSQVYEGKFGAFLTHKSGNEVASFTAIPKGAPLPDTGNESPKERILVGQDLTYASQHPYYRVAN